MKKLVTLLLAAGLLFGAATGASAVDFKAKGEWIMGFDYGQGGALQDRQRAINHEQGKKVSGFNGESDKFNAMQRVRLQLEAIASESLSGTVMFEMGEQTWGKAAEGGALGADGKAVGVKRAFIDYTVPQADITVRMGLQGVTMPAFTNGSSQVVDADQAGIAASYKFNDNVSATVAWGRPYNDNYVHYNDGDYPSNYLDNVDVFTLLLPLSFDGAKIIPWATYAMVGRNALTQVANLENNGGPNFFTTYTGPGIAPAVYLAKNGKKAQTYGNGLWFGLTGEITAADPFRFAWDANYGGLSKGIEAEKREGFYLSVLGEYKMDWATPGLYAWYASGDDGNIKNGSERMPSIASDGDDGFSSFGSSGNPYIGRENVLAANYIGTWGIGGRLKDMSFMEDLKHTLRVNYLQGTNNPTMAKYILGKKTIDSSTAHVANIYTDFNQGVFSSQQPLYMTTQDSALELGLTTTYQVYENLTLFADMSYIAMFMDNSRSVWGRGTNAKTGEAIGKASFTDPWNINVSVVYDF